MSRHTDIFTSMLAFSNGRMAVASPASVCSRQTNPGELSARALMRSRLAAKSAMTGESIGPRMSPMFSCASSYADIAPPQRLHGGRAERDEFTPECAHQFPGALEHAG